MKKSSMVLIVLGLILMVGGSFLFNHLNVDNAVDSHARGIYINGYLSFPWPVFAGFVLLVIGIVFRIAGRKTEGHRIK
jgi:hypothetical protein